MAEQGAAQYGGFWIRLLAYLVDGVILLIATLLIIFVSAFLGPVGAIVAVVTPLLSFVYFAAMQSSARQATFGKALLGLKVTSVAGERISFLRSFAREISKIVSAIPLAIGFLMAAFTGRKQALHDLMASTVVAREGPAHVVAALAVAAVGYTAPFILVIFLGVGILGVMMGGMGAAMLGGMMADSAKQEPKTVPAAPSVPAKPSAVPAAPAAPSAPVAASAADVDKLLVPLAGLDKPGTTHAGPAVLELSTFFGSGDPKIWVRVHVPLAVSRATVVVTQVADSANQGRYDPKNSLESEFFQTVQLSDAGSGTPRKEGLRSVNLTKGTTEQQVQRIDGVLKLQVPVGVKALGFRAGDTGKAQEAGGLKLTLASLKGPDAEFSFAGSRDNLLEYRGFDAKGERVSQQSSSRSGANSGTQTLKFAAPVDRIDAVIAAEIARREYPFTLSRGGGVTAPVAAAAPKPVAAVEKPVPAPAPAKAAPPPAPEKLAAAAPSAEAAPKPKPAPRKSAATPKPEASAAAPAAVATPAAVAPPAPKVIAMPKYGDLVSAVMNRDAAGISELLQFGRWVDKPDRKGTTPLMVAATLGDMASAEVLLKAGADGGRALPIARERRDQAMLALLQRYGAR